MIKLEHTEVSGWEAAIRGMRNPMNSWDKSDSGRGYISEDDRRDGSIRTYSEESPRCDFWIGPADQDLMMRLARAGSVDAKYRRMINVTVDITAPLYWISELDTYKVGTVRNSCSFMHKGLSKQFDITDFSIQNKDIYKVLSPIEKEESILKYPYETDEYRLYETESGRRYKVYKNGRVKSCPFLYVDNYGTGRQRDFVEYEIKPSLTPSGYYELNLGGRAREKWLLHRLVATVWIPNEQMYETVNHINGDKGDNSLENLEWCSLKENIQKGYEAGLFDKNKLHASYLKWKNAHCVKPEVKFRIKEEHKAGAKMKELSEKYGLSIKTIYNLLYIKGCAENDTFYEAYMWERLIEQLNNLRDICIETKDNGYFQALRQLLPCGYNQRYTWQANYEVLSVIYKQRKNHRLDEWHDFCDWIKSLPYSDVITLEEGT